jgi:hypothetical protein
MHLDSRNRSPDPHDDGVDGLGKELHSRHHDPDSVYHAWSGSNEPGSESLLTWTRMMTESMAWARSSTPATMIRIQFTMLDPDLMNLDPNHRSPGPAW